MLSALAIFMIILMLGFLERPFIMLSNEECGIPPIEANWLMLISRQSQSCWILSARIEETDNQTTSRTVFFIIAREWGEFAYI